MTDIGRIATYGSLGLMALMAFVMLFPTTNNSHAAIEDEFSSNVHTDIKSYVRSTIALSITGQVNLDLTPKSSGTFSAETAKLSVSTNNVSGYSVYLAMVDGSSNSLLPMNTRSEEEIKATPETMTAENYTSFLNTWGYRVGGSAGYKAVPTAASTPIITESSSTKEASYDLSFAVAVGTDLPAGVYGNQVVVSTVANPIEVRGINDITYMQEMTSDICTVSFENETKQLIDTRDGKSYWVAKLKDGNCWMTQNLALDLSTSKTLTPGNTDISKNWTPTSSTNEEDYINTEASFTKQLSWNFGELVLATPLEIYKIGTDCTYTGAISSEGLAETCREFGVVNVSKAEWKPDFLAQPGNFNKKDYAIVAVDETAHTYDSHYLVGNYYQFNTATAGTVTGISTGGANADGSICPKGWRLIQAGNSPVTIENNDFYALLRAYGYPEVDAQNSSLNIIDPTIISPSNPASSPIYLTRSGSIQTGTSLIIGRGTSIWSSTVNSTNNGRRVHLNDETISFSGSITRHIGFSVRCVAR